MPAGESSSGDRGTDRCLTRSIARRSRVCMAARSSRRHTARRWRPACRAFTATARTLSIRTPTAPGRRPTSNGPGASSRLPERAASRSTCGVRPTTSVSRDASPPTSPACSRRWATALAFISSPPPTSRPRCGAAYSCRSTATGFPTIRGHRRTCRSSSAAAAGRVVGTSAIRASTVPWRERSPYKIPIRGRRPRCGATSDHMITDRAYWVTTENVHPPAFVSRRLRNYEFSPAGDFLADQAWLP